MPRPPVALALIAALALSGCTYPEPVGLWAVTAVDGRAVRGRSPTIRFPEAGRAGADIVTGCAAGAFEAVPTVIHSGNLRLVAVVPAAAACPPDEDPAAGAAFRAFLASCGVNAAACSYELRDALGGLNGVGGLKRMTLAAPSGRSPRFDLRRIDP